MSSIAERRTAVIAAYETACANPSSADWQALAHEMRATMPATTRKASHEDDSLYAPWAERDHDSMSRKASHATTWRIVFACGQVVRLSMWQSVKLASNVGKALRIAFAFYRARARRKMTGGALNGVRYYQEYFETWAECIDVPCVTEIECETTQERFDANDASERTGAARHGSFNALQAIAIAEACDKPSETLALMWRHAVLTAIAPSFPNRGDIDVWAECIAARLPHAWLTVPVDGDSDGAAGMVADNRATVDAGAPIPAVDAIEPDGAGDGSETRAAVDETPRRAAPTLADKLRLRLLSGAVGICAEKLPPPNGNWHPSRKAIGAPIPRQLAAALASASITQQLAA